MGKKRELRLKVHGVRRKEPDARRMARAIVRLAVELDAEEAQALADTLEHEEALRRQSLTRARAAKRKDSADPGEDAADHRRQAQ